MQVQDDAGAGVARRFERLRPERRVDVVGVHDPRSGALYGVRDLLRVQAAGEQAARGLPVRDAGGVALEHLDVLVQVLADQPREILDRPLLPARVAIAVVQQQDHGLQG